MPTLEIAVTSLEDALQAERGGARSLEILRDLPSGGLTPSFKLARAIHDAVQIPLNVIIRPHARDFVYAANEIETMLRDVQQFKSIGLNSFVFGALKPDGELDIALIRRMVEAAAPTSVTVHRALDASRDPEAALESLIGVAPRVLTAGPAPTAWKGRQTVRGWVKRFGAHFEFVSSGGLTLAQLTEFVATVHPDIIHIGRAARTNDVVDPRKVQRLRAVIEPEPP